MTFRGDRYPEESSKLPHVQNDLQQHGNPQLHAALAAVKRKGRPLLARLGLIAIVAVITAGCGAGAATARGTAPARVASTAATAPLSAAQVRQRYGLQDAAGCGSDASLGITACVTAYDPALTAADGISAVGVKVLVFADRASRDAWLADWTGLGQAVIAKGAWWLIFRESS